MDEEAINEKIKAADIPEDVDATYLKSEDGTSTHLASPRRSPSEGNRQLSKKCAERVRRAKGLEGSNMFPKPRNLHCQLDFETTSTSTKPAFLAFQHVLRRSKVPARSSPLR
ncbi:unnamed protein product [Symbiodinium necroappetens]|uniref:Uncharacterized protein n=1 Tax=Symbiodinium necroappetens TaxID=1628268 RepID=A0A813C1J9_9DINO|nr:unnamed protein product [Symbiodinium necroappetens]